MLNRAAWLRVLNVAQVALVVVVVALIARNEWDCYQGGGCMRLTKKQYIETVMSSVEAGWEACEAKAKQ
jgi:hypothetical protein